MLARPAQPRRAYSFGTNVETVIANEPATHMNMAAATSSATSHREVLRARRRQATHLIGSCQLIRSFRGVHLVVLFGQR
jgi:hypothetical protein